MAPDPRPGDDADARLRAATRPPRPWEVRLYLALRLLVVALCKVLFRLRVEGAHHVPTDRPYILAPVHRSNIDFAVVAVLARRRLRYIAKDSLWKVGWLGRIWYALGAFPVRRGAADREAIRTSIEVLERGEPLVLFPEGTRQFGPVVQDLFDGAAYVSGRTQVPIVPVGVGGSERAMPKGARLVKPVKLAVVVGPPIDPPAAGERGRVPRRGLQDTTARLKQELQRLYDEAQQLASPSRSAGTYDRNAGADAGRARGGPVTPPPASARPEPDPPGSG